MVRGLSRVVSSTPVIGDDGNLYVACTGGSETTQPSYQELIASVDKNNNKLLDPKELPKSPIASFFGQFDRDANGTLDEKEYESIREIFAISRTVALSILPGGEGNITDTHVRWTQSKAIPRNSSPLFYNGTLFMVKDGGICASVDAKSGELVKQGRLSGTGKYYSSPVVGDGKIYLISERGKLTVISAEQAWKQLAKADYGEDALATPAIINGRIYLRTVANLYCFGDGVIATELAASSFSPAVLRVR